jgi:dsRNA-specific ribonuclease
MTSVSSADSLQSSLGYRFKALALLEEALTHSSLVNEQKTALPQHNGIAAVFRGSPLKAESSGGE